MAEYKFTTGNKPYRIKSNETFEVKIRIPSVDCACGTKHKDLHMVKRTYSNGVVCYLVRCPSCGIEAGDEECTSKGLALLAWCCKISKEVKK